MKNRKKTATLAAAALLAAAIISIPAQAGIRYLIRERMENLPDEETEAISDMMAEQESDADSFSRDFTQGELTRRAGLFKDYQNGTFPEGELVRITDESQADKDILCYNETDSRFCLPDRELTDEELLQIIDFNYKRDYALEQSQAVQEIRAEQEKEQERLQSQVSGSGGIDEARAVETARSWMNSLFATSTDGMEENCYLEEDMFEAPTYCITFSIQSSCYYYFWISSLDGSLMQVQQSRADWHDGSMNISLENAEGQARSAFAAARSFLEEKLGIQEAYRDIHCFYYLVDGKEPGLLFQFYFIKEDGSAFQLSIIGANCETAGFCRTTEEEYSETLGRVEKEGIHKIVTVDLN